MTHDVFISYSTKDKIIADAVCAKLEESKIRVWIAPRDVPAGSSFAGSIISAINECKVFILIWSGDANNSKHILNEINRAFDQERIIIPFRIQDVLPSDEMSYYLGRTHWLDAIDPPLEKHIAALRDTVLINLGREPVPAELPTPPGELKVEKEQVLKKSELSKPEVKPLTPKKDRKAMKTQQPKGVFMSKYGKFIPFALIGLAAITMVVLYASGVFKGSGSEELSQLSIMQTESAAETIEDEHEVSETATPIPEWAIEASMIAEPILAAIKEYQPDLNDDFSTGDPSWEQIFVDPEGNEGCFNTTTEDINMGISDSSLIIQVKDECPSTLVSHTGMKFKNFVLKANIGIYDIDTTFSIHWVSLDDYSGTKRNAFSLDRERWALITAWDYETWIEQNSGKFDLESVELVLIYTEGASLIYLDGNLVSFYNINDGYYGNYQIEIIVQTHNIEPNISSVELDNVQVWDLDAINIVDSNLTYEEIAEAKEIAEPILGYINSQSPSSEDDFSFVDPNWSFIAEGMDCETPQDAESNIMNGLMNIFTNKDCPAVILTPPIMQYEDYVLQMDIEFLHTNGGIDFRMVYPGEGNILVFNLSSEGQWLFSKLENEMEVENYTDEEKELDFSESFTVTIINNTPNFLIYINSYFLTSINKEEMYTEETHLDFLIGNYETNLETQTFVIDNFKIWDISGVFKSEFEINQFGQSILDSISNQSPDFYDAFTEEIHFDWTFDVGDDEEDCPVLEDNAIMFVGGVMELHLFRDCLFSTLSHPDMSYQNYVLNLNIDLRETNGWIDFISQYSSGLTKELSFKLYSDGEWSLDKLGSGAGQESIEGDGKLDLSTPINVTIINQSPYVIVYIDNTFLAAFHDLNDWDGSADIFFNVFHSGMDIYQSEIIKIDNFMVWDLD